MRVNQTRYLCKTVFTGLIQTLGTIKRSGAEQLQILCGSSGSGAILQDLAVGDSVAVDGICLTVVEILSGGFVAIASPETLHRTTLAHQQMQDTYINLETSLRVGSKLGGHFVTGHIDGIGCLHSAVQTATSWEMIFTVSARQIARYIVPKGSIAVNGVSLTVADCDRAGSWFKVAVIPLTYSETNLQYLQPGSLVNLEGDILGKYVEKFLQFGSDPYPVPTPPYEEPPAVTSWEDITPEFLAENGFL